jgi:hypothetical protein
MGTPSANSFSHRTGIFGEWWNGSAPAHPREPVADDAAGFRFSALRARLCCLSAERGQTLSPNAPWQFPLARAEFYYPTRPAYQRLPYYHHEAFDFRISVD